MKDELLSAATKATPPVSVTVWQYFFGLPVEKWVAVATLFYIILQAYFLLVDRIEKRNTARIERMEMRLAGERERQRAQDAGGEK